MTKLKKSSCDKTHIVTKLKLWQNSNCDTTKNMTKILLWPKKKKKTQIVTKLKNSIGGKTQDSNCDKTWIMANLNLWQKNPAYGAKSLSGPMRIVNRRTYGHTAHKRTNRLIESGPEGGCFENTLKGSCSKNILTPWQPMRCSLGNFAGFSLCFSCSAQL